MNIIDEAIINLWWDGFSIYEIAYLLGLSYDSVIYTIHRHKFY